jgi:hypothetical protein
VAILLFIQGPQISAVYGNVKSYPVFKKEKQGLYIFLESKTFFKYNQQDAQFQLNHASSSSKQAWHVPDALCTVLELLIMGRKTAQDM